MIREDNIGLLCDTGIRIIHGKPHVYCVCVAMCVCLFVLLVVTDHKGRYKEISMQ